MMRSGEDVERGSVGGVRVGVVEVGGIKGQVDAEKSYLTDLR